MKRAPPETPTAAAVHRVLPSAENAELASREAARVMAPLARWLLRHGVSYTGFAELLKPVFVEAARGELAQGPERATQSALSMLSGVHRKDVRALEQAPRALPAQLRPPLASQVFTRWVADARYRGADGQPRALPRGGTRRSFETLCREFSNDVHPRTVLDELLRLGLVELDGERLVPVATAFVPAPQLDQMTTVFSANAADHLAAAVSNLTLDVPKFLEQSIYADGLTPESIELLHQGAREAWATAFAAVVGQARERVALDTKSDGDLRMRFGVYFYSEPADHIADPTADPAADPAADPSDKRRAAGRKPRVPRRPEPRIRSKP
jgi:hypothetical protein